MRNTGLVVLAAGSGLRQGECFGLTWDRIDFDQRTLTVDRQLVLLPGSGPRLAPPKTQASYRTVPISAVVLDALSAHRAQFEPGPDGLIFTNQKGEPLRRNRFGESVWRPAVKAAGLSVEIGGMHDLRHFYASLLIHRGVSVTTVQARLGHASASETLDTYAHLWPDSDDDTREAVEAVLGPRVSNLVSDPQG